MAKKSRQHPERPRASGAGPHPVAVAIGFAVLALAVYAPALEGPFFSDDQHYVERNLYIQNPSLENWIEIWSPTSIVVVMVENWAPVHLTLHALAWQWFGPKVFGHHVLGVLMHALGSALLFALLARSGIPRRTALGLAAFFLVAPANVEAVAWISQLKTSSSLVLALTALLLHPRRPGLALLAFGLALLAKPTAAVALPVALVFCWARREPASSLAWLGGWAAAFAGFAAAELAAFFETAGRAVSLYDGPAEQLRSQVAIAFRYALMAIGGWKLSLFHEPAAARSWLDPWWFGGLALVVAIAWRSVTLVRRRSQELGYWVWAVASFAPVSGIVALPYPMADRYLYFILPGLLGALAFALPEAWQRFGPAPSARSRSAAAVVAVLGIAAFGFAANRHATLWADPELLLARTERVYPDGQIARLRSAYRAAAAGDGDAATRQLREAVGRGFDRLDVLLSDPVYVALRGHAGFDALVDQLARGMVEHLAARTDPSQAELRVLAQARIVLRDLAGAERAYRRSLEIDGPYAEAIERELALLLRDRRFEAIRKR
ncbi:MAG: hypothetical protein VX681_16425 [Myxococcota bacterium]|nr:hypothetical protein [Myxococcota bacterium]